jgi:hypothetical protein
MSDIKYLDVPTYLLALGDLLRLKPYEDGRSLRRLLIEETSAAKIYLPLLQKNLDGFLLLPKAILGPPLSDLLSQTDQIFDGLGGAIYFYCEVISRHPYFTPEQKAEAEKIRKGFIPALAELRKPLPAEATSTAKRQEVFGDFEASLKTFVVPVGGAEPPPAEGEEREPPTLYDWVRGYLDAGEKIGHLLSERASLTAEAAAEATEKASTLRFSGIGLINRFRQSLSDELEGNADLPRNLDALVFGFFDQLAIGRMNAAARAAAESPTSEAVSDGAPLPTESSPTEPTPSPTDPPPV